MYLAIITHALIAVSAGLGRNTVTGSKLTTTHHAATASLADHQPPAFLHEPTARMPFSNDSGAQLYCAAHGTPAPLVTWVLKDGSPVSAVPGLRQLPGNGTLYFPPFAGQYFRGDVHQAVYRCRASNAAGTLLSRDVSVQAVVRNSFDVHVEGKDIILGNVAFLRCQVPEAVRDFIKVTAWQRGDEILVPEQADIAGRYAVVSGTGDLHIRTVRNDDSARKFSCLVTNTLSGERKQSDAVYLSVKDITTNMAPRSNQKPTVEMNVDRGNDIHLPCNIQGNPLPVFTWYRVSESQALYPVPTSQRILPYQSLLLIKNTDERDSGKWVCKASNQFGEQRLEVRLQVNAYLAVHIHPQLQHINSGGTAVFNCSVAGAGAFVSGGGVPETAPHVEWFHNGAPLLVDGGIGTAGSAGLSGTTAAARKLRLLSPVSLAVADVSRSDRGIYQCVVTNRRSSAQAAAELKLGDIVPELIYTFIEQNVRPGPHISLKCSATGSPPPQFTWLLDSQPILDVSALHRYAIGQFVDSSGDVISHLNISHVRTDDGGLYRCVASNSMGTADHSARLNVYGPPYVRATGPVKAIAGESYRLFCPFSGYPIEAISWEKGRHEITTNSRYEVASPSQGGHLKLHNVEAQQDAGLYTCIVRSRAGEEARRDLQLIVNSPPVIEPFHFPKNLQEGGRAQVTCSVSAGDMPVFFSWRKDGQPIGLGLQVTEKKDEFFTLLVFKDISARHSGVYTCFATNAAAKVSFSSELLVRVPPRWVAEPQDTALMLGNAMAVHCRADGFPPAVVSWSRGVDKSSKEFRPVLGMRSNSSLLVDFATEEDEGYYMCQVGNGVGAELKKIIYVNVNEPARFDQPMANVSSKRNDAITLSCLARGDEPINILWSHNGARIDLNNYRLNIAEMKNGDGVNSQLSISRSDRHDSGPYKCSAENPFGKSEHTIYLAVQERPDTPSHLEIVEVNSRSVHLSWRRPFDGNSPVLSYIVQYQPMQRASHAHRLHPASPSSASSPTDVADQGATAAAHDEWQSHTTVNLTLPTISGQRSSLDGSPREQATVSGLHPSTTYMVRMLAVNEIEHSAYTEPVIIKTREEAPAESPQQVQVQAGTTIGELVVTWQPPAKDTWNGDLIGYTINCTEERQNINYIGSSNETAVRRSIRVDGFATTKATVAKLKTYRRYAISVRAVNGFGAGPWSMQVFGTTLEGVPEAPPQNVNCSALSSQSIKIAWTEPALQYHGGVILGYKIIYRPLVQEIDLTASNEIKRTSNLETYVHALYKATNYSIRVLAYTSSGDGVTSNPVYCCTEDDVPEPPANIKAAALTADSILISWLAPKHRNGLILHYTVYSREAGKKGQAKSHMVRVDEEGNPASFEARGMSENQMYEFWVSASTSVGEGEPTAVVAQATNTRAPARIASFSQTVRRPVGTSLNLQCLAVGNPTPRARWFTRDRPITFSPFYDVAADGSLKIHAVEQTLAGNYTCSAKNLFGEDAVVYRVIAMKPPQPPQINVNFAAADSIRISWEGVDDGGTPIQGYVLQHRQGAAATGSGGDWVRVDLTAELKAYTMVGLRCGTQYVLKMSAMNGVGDGQTSEEFNVWTKGKKPIEPEEGDLIQTNSSCIHLNLSSWNNGGCPISHFSIEHRPLGDIRWTVVSSDISNSDENRESLVFCDFLPATWYQLKMSASNDAGRSLTTLNFATRNVAGNEIPVPHVFPGHSSDNDDMMSGVRVEQSDWILACIVAVLVLCASLLICVILRHRGILCGPISSGYDTRSMRGDSKDDQQQQQQQQQQHAHQLHLQQQSQHHQHLMHHHSDDRMMRNQQVYSASPVKTIVDKCNADDEEMYEISPYATFSVSGGRTQAKTPTRGVTTSTLDYTVQFKTFGHPEGEMNLNATAYPMLGASGSCERGGGGSGGGGSGGHIKGKSSWHKHQQQQQQQQQRYASNTDDDSTLSKSMTLMVGSTAHRNATSANSTASAANKHHRGDSASTRSSHLPLRRESGSDTSASPVNEFSNTPTYRVPTKSPGLSMCGGHSGRATASDGHFRPDSSTESNNDQSPVMERRSLATAAGTPRHIADRSGAGRSGGGGGGGRPAKVPRDSSHSMDLGRAVSNNSFDSDAHLRFRPPTGFSDSREFSEAECDRALDLEVQSVLASGGVAVVATASTGLTAAATDAKKIDRDELSALLARYQEKKDMERTMEYTIHV